MKKIELIQAVAKSSGVTQKDIEKTFAAYAELVKEALAADKKEVIPLPSLGNFKTKHVEAKDGIDRMHGNVPWHKDACDQIVFKVSESIKEI